MGTQSTANSAAILNGPDRYIFIDRQKSNAPVIFLFECRLEAAADNFWLELDEEEDDEDDDLNEFVVRGISQDDELIVAGAVTVAKGGGTEGEVFETLTRELAFCSVRSDVAGVDDVVAVVVVVEDVVETSTFSLSLHL